MARKYAIYNDPVPIQSSSELKYVDTAIALGTVVNNAGSWTKLSFPAQGTTSITRVADRARIVSLEFSSYINAVAQDALRFILIQTKGLFTSAPATTDLLATANILSPYAYNARDLYEILYDELLPLAPLTQWDPVLMRHSVTMRIPEMKFVPGSTNVYNGQIYLLQICSTGANVGAGHYFRLWFEDGN